MLRYPQGWLGCFLISLAWVPIAGAADPDSAAAEAIYEATRVQGGLVVHLGCGDGHLTAALRAGDRYLVQGLDTDVANVKQAREWLHARELYGPVSVARFDGRHLPYVRDTVNLLVSDDPGVVAMEEILRVLAPSGVAYIRLSGQWQRTVKPQPDGTDQWSHFLHDASGNAVANDSQVGPPKRLRWVAEPRWCRSHEIPSSVNAVVTAGGRLFTIFDEGPTGVYRKLPQQCQLVARDAANGVLLWKAPLSGWQPELGTGTGNRWNIHHTIPRRLVAQGDRVYVTLEFRDSPVSVLDAATGRVLTAALEGTQGTDEMILSDGVLVVKITPGRSVAAGERIGRESLDDALAGIDVETGKQLWRKEHTRVVPYALSAQAGRVVYHDLDALVCLDAKTGDELWRAENVIRSTVGAASTLVISDGVVLFHGHGQTVPAAAGRGKKANKGGLFLTAYSLDDGMLLWKHGGSRGLAGACTQPTDLFVVDGTVWCGDSLSGCDLRSGEVQKTLSLDKLISPGHHYRCHRGKATEQFLIWPKRGAEFIDIEGGEHMRHDWLRAPCFTGATPANGLFYVPPSQCFCYPGVKVFGFLALAGNPAADDEGPVTDKAERLQKGPAYGKFGNRNAEVGSQGKVGSQREVGNRNAEVGSEATRSATTELPHSALRIPNSQDWPTYRRDGQRSGSTGTDVPAPVSPRWEVELACQGSQPVIVGDRLWVAEKNAHRIRCFSAASGQDVWSFTAGGRIDSAPTVDGGLVLFGCRDGAVYCLRAADGALVWRFDAAPDGRQIVSYGQLESVWPIHGSVLVQDSVVYFAAGRSSFLDGGILVYALDAQTGQVLHEHLLEGPWPDIHQDTGTPFAMEGALPDLFVSDGRDLYMQRIKFDAQLNRLETTQESSLGELDMGANHLVATGGFLDDTGFDRLFWMYSRRWPGFYFAQYAPKSGQLVVFDESTTYAVKYFYRRIQWSPAFLPAEQGYLLFADDNNNQPILPEKNGVKPIDWLPKAAATDAFRRGGRGVEKGTGYMPAQPAKWQTMIPLRIRAMVLAGDRLFAAGTPDVLDETDPLAAFEGRNGALLQVFSTEDGSLLQSQTLESLPAFDGLSAAAGRLYLATRDGKVICFGETEKE